MTNQGAIYNPNETDLKVTALAAYVTNLEALNDAVDTTETAIKNARIARDHSFYDEKTGIPDISNAVKEYIKSVYGAGSPEYKLATAIQFTQP